MFEVAHAFGWRRAELKSLKVGQLDFPAKTIRLYDTKNASGRVVVMTQKIEELLTACCEGKGPDDFVFTRDGKPIVEYRKAWERARDAASCPGLLLHDLRRTAIRNLRRIGVGESVAMKISGHKTASVFKRYDIVSEDDIRDVSARLDQKQISHSSAIVKPQNQLSEGSLKVEVLMVQ